MPQVTISFDIPEKLCRDIIITACEGGIGYWSVLRDYDGPDINDNKPGSLPLYLMEEEDYEPGEAYPNDSDWPLVLDVNAVVAGLRLLISERPDSPLAQRMIRAIVNYESGDYDYDAGDADVVVQYALLGEERYG